jgi:hypothetical protein
MTELQRIERIRQDLPETVGKIAQVVVDNPGQMALIAAATVVLTRAAANIVRPRTPLEGLALLVVLNIAMPKLAMMAAERGWLAFKTRDQDGKLIPLVFGKCEDAPAT